MSAGSNSNCVHDRVCSKLKPAIIVLMEATDYADDTASDRWMFAVSIRRFQELGLSETDLRWLVRKGYVEHAREITRLEDDGREFLPTGDLSFCERTCFVLTNTGVKYAKLVRDRNGAAATGPVLFERQIASREEATAKVIHEIPVWDIERRELRVNGKVVKQFKWSAANQEAILAAFEEDQWPVRIDDPLPPHPEQDSKRRLSDTIKCLNRKQKHPLIHFRGDGTGEGVVWELVKPSA